MATFKRDHSEFTQDGITIKGDHNIIRGRGCTVIGDHNHIYGDECTIKGDHNHIYSRNCNVYGDFCHDNGSNNYLGKGNFSKGSFSAVKPFSAIGQEPVQYVEQYNSGSGLANVYVSPYQKKLNSEQSDYRIYSNSSQLLTVREEPMSSDGKKVEMTSAAKMQAIAEKARRAAAKAVKEQPDNDIIEKFEDLNNALEEIRKEAAKKCDSTIDLMYDEMIDNEKQEEAKKKAEKEKKAAELVRKAELRQLEKKRQLEEEEIAKKVTEETNLKNLGALAGLLAQMNGGAPTTTAAAPSPPSK
jgi:hypothetical protein